MAREGKTSKWGWLSKLFAWRSNKNGGRVVAEKYMEQAWNAPHYKKSANGLGKNSVLKVAAICGSLSTTANNLGLINAATEIAKESISGMEIELLDLSGIPLLNPDLITDDVYPDAVVTFRKKLQEADCVLFATPEYVYSVSGVLKNALDWASLSPNVMGGKPAAVMTAAGDLGGARAQYHLRQMGVYLDLQFVNKPEVFVKAYSSPKKFDENGNLIDTDVKASVKELLLGLQSLATKLLSSRACGPRESFSMVV
ncbi:hypothetical protein SUGI_1065350 [Cryptomeria japonica]|uniref:NAD(P)H:quinone oxidoreductase n=1 Tax=Cryptomeria japonica TaxID=3369 RepID=UPI002414BE8A|nr:NAD(P)H:quinone oxidoreductase [Cryptomeria japonica]GLJ50090.1 hypothetical protein SUGI_1065350 [Cryptomeria japonica]